VEGLGCGHLIAPVLARLDEMEGAARVEVDRSGTLLRIPSGGGHHRVLAELRKLGIEAQELSADAPAIAEATSWYSRANILELSRQEFRLLARRWTAQVGRLTGEQERMLIASIEDAMDEALRSIPLEGGLRPEWTSARENAASRVLEAAATYLDREQVAELQMTLAQASAVLSIREGR
jgi:hypothetical protein